jgi:glycine cleavage system H protein
MAKSRAKHKVMPDLLYAETHEWASIEDREITVGLTPHGLQLCGTLTSVDLPEVGDEFEQFEQLGAYEGENGAGDLHSPVSGRVVAINDLLENSPEIANQDPYAAGWMIKLVLTEEEELDHLLEAEDYQNMVSS